jgi:quercetin dioxygenase-like cupin family protein
MALTSVMPGGGPPPHIHRREDESFYLLDGTLTLQAGGKTIHASPGDFVHIPRGTVHSFKNTGDAIAKLLVVATPAGVENFFAEAFYPAVEGAEAPTGFDEEFRKRAAAAAAKYGLELLPPSP